MRKLAGKVHPNMYEFVSLLKLEQAAPEVTLMQVAAWGLKSRKYRIQERLSIKEKYEAGDYTLSELVKPYSHWVLF